MISEAFALDDTDDVGFVQQVSPIVVGVLRLVEPSDIYVVKLDNWFGDKWLGFSNKLVGAVGVQYRRTLRVPPFVPARVTSQRFFTRDPDNHYVLGDAPHLHIAQTSEDNARRLMSVVCPRAAAFWWSGDTKRNRRGSLMAYLPTNEGHTGWYAEFQARSERWTRSKTVGTTAQELEAYAADGSIAGGAASS